MRTLHVHLQEGFEGDRVTVFADGKQVGSVESAKTRHQIGLAAMLDIQVEDDCQLLRVLAERSGSRKEKAFDVGKEANVAISIDPEGNFTVAWSSEGFFYA